MIRRRTQRGFTLMEVVFAIFILAAALTTLLGLQNSTIQRTLRDQNKQRAMLYARRVLAALESGSIHPEAAHTDGSLEKILEDYVPDFNAREIRADDLSIFSAHLDIAPWKVPLVQSETSLMKVVLAIWWSSSPLDRFETTYFVPQDELLQQ